MDSKKINILCIESSTANCSVCIGENDKVLAVRESSNQSDHAKNLTNFIKEILEDSKINIKDISAIAFSQGPGSYTGLRIGASVVKGLCFGLNIPLITLDSCQILSDHEQNNCDYTIGVIDARKGNAYVSVKDHLSGYIHPTLFVTLNQEYFEPFKGKKIILNGAIPELLLSCIEELNIQFKINYHKSTSLAMVKSAYRKYVEKKFSDPVYFSINYINSPNITIKRNINI